MLEKLTLVSVRKNNHCEIGMIKFEDEIMSITLNDGIDIDFLPIQFRKSYIAGNRELLHNQVEAWLSHRTGSKRQQVMECLKRAGYNSWSLKNMFYLNEGFSDFDFVYAKELFTGDWDFELWADTKTYH